MDWNQPGGLLPTLEKLLTCPVCLDVPRNKSIQACVNGHLVCAECRAALPSRSCCPVCKSKASEGWTRALLAEQIIDMVPLPCRNKFLGNLLLRIKRLEIQCFDVISFTMQL